jgi:hypothetical protein
LLLTVGLMLGIVLGPSLQALAHPSQASAATAASATPSAGVYCQLYEQTVIKDLGVSQSKLESANKDALQAVINQMYKDGKITQAQQAQAEQQLTEYANNPCAALAALAKHKGAAMSGPNAAAVSGARSAIVNAVAGALHLTPSALQTDLQSGKTVAELTSAQGVSKSAVDTAYLAAVHDQLATAVSNGTLTSAQSDMAESALKQAVAAGHYPLLDGKGAGMGAGMDANPAGMMSGVGGW